MFFVSQNAILRLPAARKRRQMLWVEKPSSTKYAPLASTLLSQPPLYETEHAEYLRANVQFSKKRSWVRHDEHYHVDFEVACVKG